MNSTNILIVEDEKNLGITLYEYLCGLNHNCRLATSVKEAKSNFLEQKPQVILMDIGLPDGNGLELAKEFRKDNKEVVILFLSAQNDPETKVKGLEIGAEDYITKPFAIKELVLRLDRIFNRLQIKKQIPSEIKIGNLVLLPTRYQVRGADNVVYDLSQKEMAILELLYENKNEAIKREEIIQKIWGEDAFPSNRTVDNYIVKLRKWCETDPKSIVEIISVRGIGYKLVIN